MEPLTDWDTYRQTALDMLRGLNPSITPSNSAPPIVSFLIIPLAILPRWVGYVLGAVIMLLAAIVAVKRLQGDLWAILLLCTTPFLLHNILWGNVEWIPLVGMLLPPAIGLVWLSGKPQTSIGSMAYYVIKIFQRKLPVKTLIPLIIVGLLGLLLYGYPFSMQPLVAGWKRASYDIFPWGVPFGVALLVWAIKREDVWLAYAASPLLSPYFTSHTLIGAYLVLVTRSKRWAVVAWIAAWMYAIATIGRV